MSQNTARCVSQQVRQKRRVLNERRDIKIHMLLPLTTIGQFADHYFIGFQSFPSLELVSPLQVTYLPPAILRGKRLPTSPVYSVCIFTHTVL